MAKTFLDSGDIFTSATSNTIFYGSSGLDSVIILAGVSNNTFDQNVDRVSFSVVKSAYLYQQTGNILNMYSGTTFIAKMVLQNDADGTQLSFGDGVVSATIAYDAAQGKAVMKVGGAVVADSAPSALGSTTPASSTVVAQANALSAHNLTIGNLLTTSDAAVIGVNAAQKWGVTSLTYSFNTQIPSDYVGNSALTANWSSVNTAEKTAIAKVFVTLAGFIPVRFTETAGQTGDIRFNVVNMGAQTAGFAYYPGTGLQGDVWLSLATHNTAQYYDDNHYGSSVVIHEIGHAMGLKHSFEAPTVPVGTDNTDYTVMSYTNVRDVVPIFTVANNTARYTLEANASNGYAMDDIATLQALYGANRQTATGNNTYTVSSRAYEHLTIWDAGGTDTINAASATGASTINMRAGTLSTIDLWPLAEQQAATIATLAAQGYRNDSFIASVYSGSQSATIYTGLNNLAIAYGVVIENVITGSGNDIVTDNAVDNVITTGNGDDVIFLGAGGYDTVDGGAGVDTVNLLSVNRSQVQQERQTDNSLLIVSNGFAAKLIGIEKIMTLDGALTMVA